jgi:hypothetical protein
LRAEHFFFAQRSLEMRGFTITTLSAAAVLACAVGAHAGTACSMKGACGSDAWSGTSLGCTPPHGPNATIQAATVFGSCGRHGVRAVVIATPISTRTAAWTCVIS